MALRRVPCLLLLVSVTLGCRSGDDSSSASRQAGSPADSLAGTPGAVRWFDGVEPMLLLPTHSSDRAIVAMADTASDPAEGDVGTQAALIRLDGSRASASVSVSDGPEGCVEAALSPAPSAPWGVGFVGTAAKPLAVDSLRGLSRQDSIALVRVIFQLASKVPNDAGGRFAGLPFSLVDVWRLRLADGRVALVATTKRQINQEDSPLEERTLVVAERDSNATEYEMAFSSRATGSEETVEGTELLAATTFGASPAVELVIAHDYGGQMSYSIIERTAPGRWSTRWSSRRFSC